MQDVDPDENYNFFSQNNSTQCNYFTVNDYNSLYSENSLSLINSNVRSFNRNFDSLSSIFLDDKLPSIFCLSETHFSLSTIQQIPDYDSFHTVRNRDTASGGISIFTKSNLNAKKIDIFSFCNSTIEICSIEFNFGKHKIIILGVYRPHSDTIENFNLAFSDILSNQLLKNKFCIVMGDLNICLLKPNSPNANFSNLLFSHHFMPLITKATRFPQIDGEIPSCLDHIWINKFFDLDAGIVSINISDHLPTFLNLKLGAIQQDEKTKVQFRLVDIASKTKFKTLLANFNWNTIKSNNPDVYTDAFISTLDKLYCSAFPLKTKYVSRKHKHNPWINDSLKNLIDAKSQYFQLYRLSLVSLAENNRFRNRVNAIIRKKKKLLPHKKED